MPIGPLDVAEIERCMEATGAGVLLVPERLLRRVIKRHLHLPGVGFDVPHAASYAIERADLSAIVEESELGRPASSLPASVILLPRPEPDPTRDRDEVVVALWRGAFHASVHRELERKIRSGTLSEATIRSRIHAIGPTEFDEIRFVLRQDDALLPPEDDARAYVEFAATYLELRAFAPHSILHTFPALADLVSIDRTLALDLDDRALFDRTRPVNAPSDADLRARLGPAREPVAGPLSRRSEPHSLNTSVSPAADRARARGNAVRSLLLAVRVQGTERRVDAELRDFLLRIAKALRWESPPLDEWASALLPLIHVAGGAWTPAWNVETRMLYDLQKVCIDAERELYTVGLVEWAISNGKVPARRPLPALREARIVQHLDAALEKAPKVPLDERARGPLLRVMRAMRKRAESNLRESLGPKIERALDEVGLVAENVPTIVSRKKLVLELCDQIVAHGTISLGHLRDSISRSSVKLENLELADLWSGDALLRADQILSRTLDGVYRRGEFYLRGLQKLSSVAFGTSIGRFITMYALLPLIGAYVLIMGLQHTVGLVLQKVLGGPEADYMSWPTFGGTAAGLFLLLHFGWARLATRAAFHGVGVALRFAFVDLPRWFGSLGPVRAFFASRPVRLVARYGLKPALFTAVLGAPVPLAFTSDVVVLATAAGGLFVVGNILLNSRLGLSLEEATFDFVVRKWREVRKRLLPGLLGLVMAFFRRALELVDRFIYAVDELLRFREGESVVSLSAKASLGVVWFFVTYAIRISVNLFLEPEVNLIKHIPVVTVAAKIMFPFTLQIHNVLALPLRPIVGGFVTEPLVAMAIFVMPGFFGFLAWELKENWRLYDANRAEELEPVRIGHHGETMAAFMKPGLHSGTIPKLYSKLRRASSLREGSVVRHRAALHHVEESIRRFAERELVPLFAEGRAWTAGPVQVSQVDVASNRVRLEIVCAKAPSRAAKIAFDEQSGWLIASVADRGFIDVLDERERIAFENALVGLYKMAGVELVREQIADVIGTLPYDITDQGLIVWPDRSYRTAVRYGLLSRGKTIHAAIRVGLGALPASIPSSRIFFRDQKVLWTTWVDAWAPREAVPPRLASGAPLFGTVGPLGKTC